MGLWRPILLVLASSTSIQFGTAIATTAFDAAGPLGAVWLRGLIGAAVMVAWIRPDVRRVTRTQWRAVVPYALALALMVAAIYLALADAPLGVVSAILMLGPLGVSALGSRGPLDLLCVAIAALGAGILTLSQGTDGPVAASGIGLALLAAFAFGAYIHTGKRVAGELPGLLGVALALPIVAIVQAPLGLTYGKPDMWEPSSLLPLAAAGVLATVVPFSLEVTALKSLSMATFGLLLSFEPGLAALAGFAIRGEVLTLGQLGGIALVIAASAGSLGPRGWTRKVGAYNRALMSNPTVAALGKVALFSGLSAKDLSTLASVAEERDVQAGVVLTEQGAAGDEFFLIADGEVEVRIDDRPVRRLGPGDYLGEIALVFGGKRTATAVVARPTKLYVLGEDAFTSLLRKHPRIEDKVLTTVTERMRYRG
jgi:inner membrane transporter RhtA